MAWASLDDSTLPIPVHPEKKTPTSASRTNILAGAYLEGVTVHTRTNTEPLSIVPLKIFCVIGETQAVTSPFSGYIQQCSQVRQELERPERWRPTKSHGRIRRDSPYRYTEWTRYPSTPCGFQSASLIPVSETSTAWQRKKHIRCCYSRTNRLGIYRKIMMTTAG